MRLLLSSPRGRPPGTSDLSRYAYVAASRTGSRAGHRSRRRPHPGVRPPRPCGPPRPAGTRAPHPAGGPRWVRLTMQADTNPRGVTVGTSVTRRGGGNAGDAPVLAGAESDRAGRTASAGVNSGARKLHRSAHRHRSRRPRGRRVEQGEPSLGRRCPPERGEEDRAEVRKYGEAPVPLVRPQHEPAMVDVQDTVRRTSGAARAAATGLLRAHGGPPVAGSGRHRRRPSRGWCTQRFRPPTVRSEPSAGRPPCASAPSSSPCRP